MLAVAPEPQLFEVCEVSACGKRFERCFAGLVEFEVESQEMRGGANEGVHAAVGDLVGLELERLQSAEQRRTAERLEDVVLDVTAREREGRELRCEGRGHERLEALWRRRIHEEDEGLEGREARRPSETRESFLHSAHTEAEA